MDVAEQSGKYVVVSYQLRCSELSRRRERWQIRFRFTTMHFGIEFRLFSTGAVALSVKHPVEIETIRM